jgi:hypothetical protein
VRFLQFSANSTIEQWSLTMAVSLFDVNFYRAANSDLSGFSDAQASAHFLSNGLNEGRLFSPFVNLGFYRSSNPDLANLNNRQLFEHLSNRGVAEGRIFSPFVDTSYYLSVNPDVNFVFQGNREAAFDHLRTNGLVEERLVSQFVNLATYKLLNPDLDDLTDRQALEHLQIYGLQEGRLFDDTVNLGIYLNANPDVAQAFGGDRFLTLQHLELRGLNENRTFSQYYDTNFYRANNPDLAAANLSGRQLFTHFESNGIYFEQRQGRSDLAGNTLATASTIRVDFTPNLILEFVGPTDTNDYYRFTLAQVSTIFVGAERQGNNVTVSLLDNLGNVIQSDVAGDEIALFTPTLQPGTYFLRFQPTTGRSIYAFDIEILA